MKIKTIIFWILWVGNSLTLQTVSGEDFDPISPALFPGDLEDVDLLCQTFSSSAPQKEQLQLAASAYQVVRLRNPPLSLPNAIAKEALRNTFGADVCRERTARRISQEELAARCKLNPRTAAKIEAGEIGIRPETLDRIQRAIGCTLDNGAIEKPKLNGKERPQ